MQTTQKYGPSTAILHGIFRWYVSTPGRRQMGVRADDHLQGLYMNILERPNDITSMFISDVVQETCKGWDAYSNQAVVDQIDSGLKG